MTKQNDARAGRSAAAPASKAQEQERNAVAKAQQPLVLVVDDFVDNREMYCEFLTFAGYRVIEAGTGHEALEQAFEHRPDIVLMDLSLPGLDGWEATRKLKGDARTQHIPVVALTGHALAGHSQGAKDAGCDGFIAKPCLPEDLVAEVKKLLAAQSKPSLSKGKR